MKQAPINIKNKRASHDYEFIETYTAGMVLTGTEIKSVRNGSCNIRDCYGIIRNDEVFLLNMFINHYKEGNIFNHEETRTRKLLLHKKEIIKIKKLIDLNGYTLVPLKLYFNQRNKLKVLLGVCKGKKDYDKRETIKQRDINREVKKNLKNY